MPFKYFLILILVFITIIVCEVVFLSKNQAQHNSEMKLFLKKEINGKIVKLNDLSRGTYSLEISQKNFLYESPSLPIAFDIEKYNIQIGDSISKEANSGVMVFYKNRSGTFEKCCNF